jgi:hypothetical protein
MDCARFRSVEQRPTFDARRKRRRKTNLASIEFAGRWSLLHCNSHPLAIIIERRRSLLPILPWR